mmetsp:Transcript_166253/g.533873  ORF Transcript_166253/g.533873 Transcript_166253/m.533873 type:complete len:246 (-) Transcript_166253:1157-1894(-)
MMLVAVSDLWRCRRVQRQARQASPDCQVPEGPRGRRPMLQPPSPLLPRPWLQRLGERQMIALPVPSAARPDRAWPPGLRPRPPLRATAAQGPERHPPNALAAAAAAAPAAAHPPLLRMTLRGRRPLCSRDSPLRCRRRLPRHWGWRRRQRGPGRRMAAAPPATRAAERTLQSPAPPAARREMPAWPWPPLLPLPLPSPGLRARTAAAGSPPSRSSQRRSPRPQLPSASFPRVPSAAGLSAAFSRS